MRAQTAPETTKALAPFVRQRNVLLTTYRRDGTPKGTPVHIAVDGDHAYCRTWDRTWKLRRIRRNPHVTVAPSTARGMPIGPAIPAHARVLTGDEAAQAARALAHKYPILDGIVIPRFHRLRGYTTVHLELIPDDETAIDTEGA
jgi:PPOX class probable F420-dependent enzyme